METHQADRRMRAFSALEGLRQSLPAAANQQGSWKGVVTEIAIRQYETALDDLAACGEDIDQYRLGFRGGEKPVEVILATELNARVLAVLGYFTIRDAVRNQASTTGAALESLIGFETPQKQ
jgi:hypothetical protein